jgi:hypothetical protein
MVNTSGSLNGKAYMDADNKGNTSKKDKRQKDDVPPAKKQKQKR